MINPNELNEYSKKVYYYLKKESNILIEKISLHPSDFGKNYLLIELDPKSKNTSSPLFFSSEDNMLTVGFCNYHCHFDKFSGQIFDEEIKIALEYFDKILHERLLVVSAGGITTLLTKEEIAILENGKVLDYFNYDCKNFYINSWSGKFDKIIKNPNA